MTNTAGEVQLVRKGGDVMGTRSDFDILRILSHQLAQQGLGQAIRLRTPEAAFDEIRQFGASSIQIMRRLRSALVELTEMLPSPDRADVVRRHLTHLDLTVECSPFDEEDRAMARQEDRQGLGLTRRRTS